MKINLHRSTSNTHTYTLTNTQTKTGNSKTRLKFRIFKDRHIKHTAFPKALRLSTKFPYFYTGIINPAFHKMNGSMDESSISLAPRGFSYERKEHMKETEAEILATFTSIGCATVPEGGNHARVAGHVIIPLANQLYCRRHTHMRMRKHTHGRANTRQTGRLLWSGHSPCRKNGGNCHKWQARKYITISSLFLTNHILCSLHHSVLSSRQLLLLIHWRLPVFTIFVTFFSSTTFFLSY